MSIPRITEIEGNTAHANGHKIDANNIIVATHFPFLNKHGSYFIKMYQQRSYVIALESAPDVKGMYIGESDDRLSFRNFGDLLLMGGGGHKTGKAGGGFDELKNNRKILSPVPGEISVGGSGLYDSGWYTIRRQVLEKHT